MRVHGYIRQDSGHRRRAGSRDCMTLSLILSSRLTSERLHSNSDYEGPDPGPGSVKLLSLDHCKRTTDWQTVIFERIPSTTMHEISMGIGEYVGTQSPTHSQYLRND